MKLNKLLKDLKTERVQGSSAVLNYSNFDYWVNWDDIVEIVENHKQPSLNENQQVVLTWLKHWHDGDPYFTLSELYDSVEPGEYKYEHELDIAYEKLSEKERFQVLAAFAEWGGMKNEQ